MNLIRLHIFSAFYVFCLALTLFLIIPTKPTVPSSRPNQVRNAKCERINQNNTLIQQDQT